MCFEVLGFDILLDKACQPYLLEVNHTPSFNCDNQIAHCTTITNSLTTVFRRTNFIHFEGLFSSAVHHAMVMDVWLHGIWKWSSYPPRMFCSRLFIFIVYRDSIYHPPSTAAYGSGGNIFNIAPCHSRIYCCLRQRWKCMTRGVMKYSMQNG